MPSWDAVVSSGASPHIALFLDDLSALAVTQRESRCCSHFDKYMTCESSLSPLTQDFCARCHASFACYVQDHCHVQRGLGVCGVLYSGAKTPHLTSNKGDATIETSYLWIPSYGLVLCDACCADAEDTGSFLQEWLTSCHCGSYEDGDNSDWVRDEVGAM